MDESVFNKVFSAASAAWAIVLLNAVALFKAWPAIMERLNERKRDRAAIEAGQYERMDARMQRLEKREEECQQRLTEALHRIGEIEGYMMGQGKAHQEAATIVAIERLSDKNGDKA